MAAASPLDSEQSAASPIPELGTWALAQATHALNWGGRAGAFQQLPFHINHAATAATLQLHLNKQN